MSESIVIKKNGVDIISWCRSSYPFQALSEYVPFDKWETFTADKFDRGLEKLREKETDYKQQIEDMNKILVNLNYEESLDCMRDIRELRTELDAIQYSIIEFQVLQAICDEGVYNKDDWDHPVPTVLEWYRG